MQQVEENSREDIDNRIDRAFDKITKGFELNKRKERDFNIDNYVDNALDTINDSALRFEILNNLYKKLHKKYDETPKFESLVRKNIINAIAKIAVYLSSSVGLEKSEGIRDVAITQGKDPAITPVWPELTQQDFTKFQEQTRGQANNSLGRLAGRATTALNSGVSTRGAGVAGQQTPQKPTRSMKRS